MPASGNSSPASGVSPDFNSGVEIFPSPARVKSSPALSMCIQLICELLSQGTGHQMQKRKKQVETRSNVTQDTLTDEIGLLPGCFTTSSKLSVIKNTCARKGGARRRDLLEIGGKRPPRLVSATSDLVELKTIHSTLSSRFSATTMQNHE